MHKNGTCHSKLVGGGVQENIIKSNIFGVGMVVNFSKVGAENRPNTFPDLQDTAPVK